MDRSFLYGDALFETVRVESGRVHRIDRHKARFASSAELLGFRLEDVEEGLSALDAIASERDGLVRVTVSRSAEVAPFGGEQSITTAARPIPELCRPSLVSLAGWYWPSDPLARHKSTSYMRWVEARRLAQKQGGTDALMVSEDGRVGETSVCNVFVRFGHTLVTPKSEGILPGVTRAAVLEHGSKLGLEVVEDTITTNALADADEIICTSAGVLAVAASSLDGRALDVQWAPKIRRELEAGWA